jgi:AcrR family transcriptional regulator
MDPARRDMSGPGDRSVMASLAKQSVRTRRAGRAGHPPRAPRRPDPRAVATKERIFQATTRVMRRFGVRGMSVQDIAIEAGVARGTLYRYFSSKTDLLDAYTEYMRSRFDASLRAAIEPHSGADGRLQAFLAFFDAYLDSEQARSFLEAEPEFALGYFRRSFMDGVGKTRDALAPVFDEWSRKVGRPLDHDMLAEFVMRFLISHVLVPAPHGGTGLGRKLMDLVKQLA